jgi:hypothetical protein
MKKLWEIMRAMAFKCTLRFLDSFVSDYFSWREIDREAGTVYFGMLFGIFF